MTNALPQYRELAKKVEDLFGLGSIDRMQLLQGGYLSKNFVVVSGQQKWFLKQYRHKISQLVHQIKFAERFFAQHGVPVILPISDAHGRPAFVHNQQWHSLFPFINRRTLDVGELTQAGRVTLARQLARMHELGAGCKMSVQPLSMWDKDLFSMEVAEIELKLVEVGTEDPVHALIAHIIEQKKRFVEQDRFTPEDVRLPFDTLLHGDFTYKNVFFSEDQSRIDHVFDFEKAVRAPQAFEVARAIFIHAFDDGWTDEHLYRAVEFLRAYRQSRPISLEDLTQGARMYLTHLAHLLWIENKVLLRGARDYVPLLRSHSHRVAHLFDDIETFVSDLYERASGD